MTIEQQPGARLIYDFCPLSLHLRWARDLGDGDDCSARELDGALVEHAGVDVNFDLASLGNDRVDGRRERSHVIPVAVTNRDAFDLAQTNPEIGAVADEDRSLR